MTIGVFTDVDNTLTRSYIQHNFARLLKVEQAYLDLEEKYSKVGGLTSDEFGRNIIELFNSVAFTEEFSSENFAKVRLKASAEALLRMHGPSIKIYFVSAGPSYYVRPLAKKFSIPPENVICSTYTFDDSGKLSDCDGVTPERKRAFVEERTCTHQFTLGLGDDPLHDPPFLGECDIGFLTPKAGEEHAPLSDNHIWMPRLALVLDVINKLDKRVRSNLNRT